jgi:hypothetical protein
LKNQLKTQSSDRLFARVLFTASCLSASSLAAGHYNFLSGPHDDNGPSAFPPDNWGGPDGGATGADNTGAPFAATHAQGLTLRLPRLADHPAHFPA